MARGKGNYRKQSTSSSANGGPRQQDGGEDCRNPEAADIRDTTFGPSLLVFCSWARTADWLHCLLCVLIVGLVASAVHRDLGALVIAASAVFLGLLAACKFGWFDEFGNGFNTGKLHHRASDDYYEISAGSLQGKVRMGNKVFTIRFPPGSQYTPEQWFGAAIATAERLSPKKKPSVKEWKRIQQEELRRIFLEDLLRNHAQAHHQTDSNHQQQHSHQHNQQDRTGSSSQHSSGQQRQQQQQQPRYQQPIQSRAEQQAWTAAAAVPPNHEDMTVSELQQFLQQVGTNIPFAASKVTLWELAQQSLLPWECKRLMSCCRLGGLVLTGQGLPPKYVRVKAALCVFRVACVNGEEPVAVARAAVVQEAVRREFKNLARLLHPDKRGSEDERCQQMCEDATKGLNAAKALLEATAAEPAT